MSAPRVYAAIVAVIRDLARTGIAKSQTNQDELYAFRGIDDVYNHLAPLLARRRLCILPRVLERTSSQRLGTNGMLLTSVSLKVAFDIVCARDGSVHSIEAYGEALDGGDKATSKAMSAAFKYAVLQAFCVPIKGMDDADTTTLQLRADREVLDPDQGWDQWSADIQDMIRICETDEALDRVQQTYRALLRACSKRRPEIYQLIGTTARLRREALRSSLPATGTALPSPRCAYNRPQDEPAMAHA